MKFTDQGIIINIKKYSENSLIVKVFSQNHGIYRSFVKSAKSAKDKAIFQIGNLISFEFRSRLEDNLGSFFAVDLMCSYCSKIMFERLKLDCVNSVFAMFDELFLERENHFNLFEKFDFFLKKISSDADNQSFLGDYIKLELEILRELGYGIDLSSCAVTQSTKNLAFVSPKSARAVSLEAGQPYENKLLKLPNFLLDEGENFENKNLLDGLELSGFFLQKFLFADRKMQKFMHRENIKKHLQG